MVPATVGIGDAILFDFFLLGRDPLVSSAHETVWDVRPWEGLAPPIDQLLVRYNDRIARDSTLGVEIYNRLGLEVPENADLVRASFRRPRNRADSITFVEASSPVTIPSGVTRGSGVDLFLCILLGLAPLLYTPESWFLLWVVSRARARKRREGRAFGLRLWSLYAIVVGVYWFAVLPGAGRIAGVIPLIVGVVQIAWPYTARDAAPVRVEFKRKRKS